ncbi:MAG: beta-glucuronidase [Colwellia sp.]
MNTKNKSFPIILARSIISTILFIAFTFFNLASATDEFSMDSYHRETISLNGQWKAIVDPYENGYYSYRHEAFDQEYPAHVNAFFTDSKMKTPSDLIEYNFDLAESLEVPGDWNTQRENLFYYEGSVWYRRTFDSPNISNDEKVYLRFGAVNYKSDVYLNGRKLGTHIGGFTPFFFDISKHLSSAKNSLIVKVDNSRHAEAVPTVNTDWWNYGGITRDVDLIVTPQTHIRDYSMEFDRSNNNLKIKIRLVNPNQGNKLSIEIPELKLTRTLQLSAKQVAQSLVEMDISLPNYQLWSPEQPKLYALTISTEQDTLKDKIGLRTIETSGKKLLLNGEEVFLRGISIHEELAQNGGGRITNEQDARLVLERAKALNCNFVRLAHYPHNEYMLRIADELGLLVWSEVPVYWTIDWQNPGTYQNAETQLLTMVERDKNRASIIIWSIANETPVTKARTTFLAKLAKQLRRLDSTRLISAAMEKHSSAENELTAIVEDPLSDYVDIISFNQYFGWYDGLPEKIDRVSWSIPYNKPVFISEFGGGAKYGLHGKYTDRWTEEYQEAIYSKTVKMLEKIDGYVGTSPWILMDFRSPRRILSGIQDNFNRKGLMTPEGDKKLAYFILQEYYRKKKLEFEAQSGTK